MRSISATLQVLADKYLDRCIDLAIQFCKTQLPAPLPQPTDQRNLRARVPADVGEVMQHVHDDSLRPYIA
jgi:hypothetical protein